jgi:hypothetical protein
MRAENKPEAGLAEGALFPAARETQGKNLPIAKISRLISYLWLK